MINKWILIAVAIIASGCKNDNHKSNPSQFNDMTECIKCLPGNAEFNPHYGHGFGHLFYADLVLELNPFYGVKLISINGLAAGEDSGQVLFFHAGDKDHFLSEINGCTVVFARALVFETVSSKGQPKNTPQMRRAGAEVVHGAGNWRLVSNICIHTMLKWHSLMPEGKSGRMLPESVEKYWPEKSEQPYRPVAKTGQANYK